MTTALLVTMLLATSVVWPSVASADSKAIAAQDDSTKVRKVTYKPKRMAPVMAVLRMPFGFKPGVPTRADLTLKFWNAPITIGTENGNLRTKTFRYYNKVFVRPGLMNMAESCRPPEGSPTYNDYNGLCKPSTYQAVNPLVSALSMPEPVKSWPKASVDIAQPNYDVTISSQGLKSKWLSKNQTARYKVWVTFPRCVPLDTTPWVRDYQRPKGVAWPCEPGSLIIGATFKLKGKKGYRGSGDLRFTADHSMYIAAPPSTPVVTSVVPTGPSSDPGGPTGPSGPSGPTG